MNECILIVEDDENVAEALNDVLSGYGYIVLESSNKKETLEIFQKKPIDLIIMDVNLGKDNGYEICKEIRKDSQVPILFLTGCSSELELIRGFQTGGDDYVTKPFRMQELLVRIQALLRRCAALKNIFYQSGDLIYNHHTCQLLKNNEVLDLSITEVKIITILLGNWPRTIPREELLYQVWDKDSVFVEENTLSVNISRIREKLGLFENHSYITTVRGVGYRWAVSVKGK